MRSAARSNVVFEASGSLGRARLVSVGRNDLAHIAPIDPLPDADGREIRDPETKESLGTLELVRGRGTVTLVQDRMCVIESNDVRTERVVRSYPHLGLGFPQETRYEQVREPFVDLAVGDRARRMKRAPRP